VRAAVSGLAFGLALATVEVWAAWWRFSSLAIGWPLGLVASDVAGILALAAWVGLLVRGTARRGPLAHALAMALVWTAIHLYAAPDFRSAAIPVAAAVLFALGSASPRPWLPAAVGCALLATGIVGPDSSVPRVAPPFPAANAPADAPDVLLVTLDGVRADRLRAYGDGKAASPAFDALAAGGALFLDAVSPAAWSLPAHASLFTGRFPSSHGAHEEHPALDAAAATLAERFAAAGWRTRAFGANPWIAPHLGTTRGFAWTDGAWRDSEWVRCMLFMPRLLGRLGLGPHDDRKRVAAGFERWVASRSAGDGPALAFVGFTGRPRCRSADDATWNVVPEADAFLGRIVGALRRAERLDRTIVVVTAGHGELPQDADAPGRGRSLYEPVLRVPLLVRFPARVPAGGRAATPVSTAGVLATLLDLAGLPPEPGVQVGSLMAVVEGGAHPGPVLAERFATAVGGPDDGDLVLAKRARVRAYRAPRWKLVDVEPGGTFLFDLDQDPDENDDVAMRERLTVARLREELDAWRERVRIPDLHGR
jgi:arylsulfatase A-like enzyme